MPVGRALIGRETELAALAAAIDADQSTVIVGEAGIGKTAIIRVAAAGSDRALREGGGFATLREIPYFALSRAVGLPLAGDAAAVAAKVESLVGPDMLFVDDLQWADGQTLAAVVLLVGRILVLAAVRALDSGAVNAMAQLGAAGAAVQQLAPLPDDAARALVTERRGDLSGRVVDEIVRKAAGNPLLLEEMADHGATSPVMARVMTGRLDALSDSARRVVELLAVADRPLPRAVLDPTVADAIDAGIAIERAAGVELRHQLVADAVRDELDLARRQTLHSRVAALLIDGPEAARHLAAAGRAAEASELALRVLATSSDPHERASLLVIAAEASDIGSGLDRRLEAARALDEVADWPAVVRVLGAADLDAGRAAEDPEGVAEAHALLAHATYSLGEIDAARRHVTAMDEVPTAPGSRAAVRCAIEAATFLVNVDGDVAAAIGRLEAAMATLPEGDPAIPDMALLRNSILWLATGAGNHDVVRAAADTAFDEGRYRTATDRARVVQYLMLMAVSSEAAFEFLLDRNTRYEAAGMQTMASEFLADAIVAGVLAGRLADAVAIGERLLETPALPRARQRAEIQRARGLVLLGRIDEAEFALEALRPAVSADYFGLAETLHGLAEAALHGGRPRDAVALAEAALAVQSPLPGGRVPLLVTLAWAQTEAGMAPTVELQEPVSPSVQGALPELRGLQALAGGANLEAAAGFDAAAIAWTRFNNPRAVMCRWAAGEARRRGGAADSAAGETAAALQAAEAMGFEPVAARARRTLRLLGIRVARREPRTTPRGLGLTARELELVSLVERGLTNVEIARRLGLGRPTVAGILTSAMTKLGASSRAQLAATAPWER